MKDEITSDGYAEMLQRQSHRSYTNLLDVHIYRVQSYIPGESKSSPLVAFSLISLNFVEPQPILKKCYICNKSYAVFFITPYVCCHTTLGIKKSSNLLQIWKTL